VKIITFSLLVTMVLSLATLTYAQQPVQLTQPQEQAQKPESPLPDFTKEPYFAFKDTEAPSILHPELGPTLIRIYHNKKGRDKLAVFFDESGKIAYAEWVEFDTNDIMETPKKVVIRGYFVTEAGTFVFDTKKEISLKPVSLPTPKSL